MKKSTTALLLVLTVFALFVTGCGLLEKQKTDRSVTLTVASATGSVTGRVVDNQTLQPITGADVTFIVNGSKRTVQTSSDPDTDIAGTFYIGDMPAGTFQVTITATGYARMRRTVSVSQTYDNTPVSVNVGTYMMMPPSTLTVLATDAGVPTAGITVRALSNTSTWDFFSAVTGTDGTAQFTDLANGDKYVICTRPKTDTAGALQFLSSCIPTGQDGTNMWDPTDSNATVALNLTKPMRDDTIQVVGSNTMTIWNAGGTGAGAINIEQNSGAQYTVDGTAGGFAIKPGQTIIMVYNYPVSVSGAITVSYLQSLVAPTTTGYGNTFLVTTATGAIDATGTVVTLTNSAPWTINNAYMVDGSVTALIGTQNFISTQNSKIGGNFYVVDDSANGLSPTTTLIADNYSGNTGTTLPTNPNNPIYVNFPEYVYGTFRVISKATNSTVQTIIADGEANLPAGIITLGTNTLNFGSFNTNAPGTANKLVYRVPLGYLSTNNTTTLNNITVHFDVRDLEGNAFSKTVTLDIL